MAPRLGTSSRRITSTAMSPASSPSRIHGGVRQQRYRPCLLDRRREPPLMASTVARNAGWDDLPTFAEERPERTGVLVVDRHRLVGAESTHLAAAKPAPAGRASLASFASHGHLGTLPVRSVELHATVLIRRLDFRRTLMS